MENKFITFIGPYLSVIDNGRFFRKPFSWLCILFAVLSLLIPFYVIYSASNLHIAYNDRDKCRVQYEIVSQKYEAVKFKYDTTLQKANKYRDEVQNANRNYNQANQSAQNYLPYIQNFRQQYDKAKLEANQWYATLQEAVKKYTATQQVAEKIKPEFEAARQELNQSSQEYQNASNKYAGIAPKGAFHTPGIGWKAIIALIFFAIFSLLIGWISFQIFWDRASKMNESSEEDDEFTAIPVISRFIQTIGEAIGTYVTLLGSLTVLIALLFKVCFGTYGLDKLFIIDLEHISEKLTVGIPYIFLPVIAGFLTVVFFRVFAEAIKAIVVIANNTRN